MLCSAEILLSVVIATASWLTAPAQANPARTPVVAAASAGPARAKTSARPPFHVRTRGERFEVVRNGVARPLVIRGVNLGAGAPGRFPGEFAFGKEDYRRFLRAARDLRANAVRVYALHPPVFYQVLREENEAHPDRALWLFQEVWTELPESNDFWDPAFSRGFERDVRVAIDAVHGNALVAPRPGHAFGRYDADVSPWLAGWLLGREWEPYAVRETESRHRDSTRFRGAHFTVDRGTAMEVWLARQCDLAVAHERARYGVAHAVSFVSWPTLDVMKHPTEYERGGREADHDEDAYAVDPTRIRPRVEAGLDRGFLGYFANYHVYPYYPDFINLDPGYSATRDRHGACNYAGYLRDLKAHTRGLPLVIGEFGVPTSRGIAHRQPQGLDHGGASETEQGRQNVRLLEDIEDVGAAGSLLFALFDEWFKVNWLVWSAERPRDRDPLWHNLLDPEESYGLIAFDPPPRIRVDGEISDWKGIAPYATSTPAGAPSAPGAAPARGIGAPLRALYVTSDQARLYLRLDVDPVALRGGVRALGVSLDVLDPKRGDTKLPAPLDAVWSRGAEFVLVVDPGRGGDDARAELFADRAMSWSPWSRVLRDGAFHGHRAPLRPVANEDGLYAPLLIETNRERVSRSGTVYPARHLDWGRLARMREPREARSAASEADPYDPRSDWHLDRKRGVIEVALPWGLLNVGDPSSRSVLDDAPRTAEIETSPTSGIGLLAWATRARGFAADSLGPSRAERRAQPEECQFLAAPGTRQVVRGHRIHLLGDGASSYLWNAWETPITRTRVKRSAEFVRRHFEGMESREPESLRAIDAGR